MTETIVLDLSALDGRELGSLAAMYRLLAKKKATDARWRDLYRSAAEQVEVVIAHRRLGAPIDAAREAAWRDAYPRNTDEEEYDHDQS